jgi:DNA modification methylase
MASEQKREEFPTHRIVRVDSLVKYENNPRTHSPAQIDKLVASIREFGFTNAILTDGKNGVVAGHGRLLAAQKLGMATVPTLELSHLSAAQRRAYILADNRLALDAGWDDDLLRLELGALQDDGFDLSLTGFNDLELADLFADRNAGLTDPDDVPETPAEPVTRTGDVWLMGGHRVMAGDSTNAQHVETLTEGKLADLCFTSPPYLNQRDYKTMTEGWDALMQGVFGILPVKDDAQVLVNLGMVHRNGEWLPYWDGWIAWMREQGWRRFGWYVWDQGPGLPGDWNGRLAPSHEWLFHFNRQSERARKTKAKMAENIEVMRGNRGGMRRQDGSISGRSNPAASLQTHKIPDSVVRVMRHKARGIEVAHAAVFPVDLVSEMLTAFSDPDDTVFEPFCGSGTQLISAQKNGRTCLAMEIAPVYVDIAVMRWQNFTGQSATLANDGRTFAEVAAARVPQPAEAAA